MCGVVGLIYERGRSDLGVIAGELLATLEYRGYDSTGAAIQGAGSEDVDLRKDVGAPSVMAEKLGIVRLAGQILCGQVRWATFGAVDRANAQPHVVRCKAYLYGAHNGNVTNCDDLKRWLESEGHDVLSDNDGEMVVHTVEHFFAQELGGDVDRRAAMRRAIVAAQRRLAGSYAAVIVDPVTRTLWAIKRGSSLYFGLGEDPAGGRFGIASSDLSAVLKLTRTLIPMSEGEVVEFEPARHRLFAIDGTERDRKAVRSRLRAEDTALLPPFTTFMEQEIHAQEETSRDVLRVFSGGSDRMRELAPVFEALPAQARAAIRERLDRLRDQVEDLEIRRAFADLRSDPAFASLSEKARLHDAGPFVSAERAFFGDLHRLAANDDERRAVRILDAILERSEIAEAEAAIGRFVAWAGESIDRGGRIYIVCCGTSFHAAKAAALFFDALAEVEVIPLLPGELRGQYAKNLRGADLFIAVSQSGETKDLIDVVNDVIATGLPIRRIALVNNVNSTLAQEKSDLAIPLRCGPEIAVPATKSFINQLTTFYGLAERLGQVRLGRPAALPDIPGLIRRTIEETAPAVEEAAEALHLAPSMHLLAVKLVAVAKEGSLKLREVVLNHTEGFEGSEFKHGPNTILGFNTIYGLGEVEALLAELARSVAGLGGKGLSAEEVARVASALIGSIADPRAGGELSAREQDALRSVLDRRRAAAALDHDYPLVYITGPDPRDVALTVSQINTHKIRGSTTVVIAEDDRALRGAAEKAPAGNPRYRSIYVALPKTGDTLSTVFSATVALQCLALRMSLRKAQHLDRLGLEGHGVHPDVPKNVSKSITVD
jgi:glucosamine 6-phosphate synthetase-like amidotransferase/phosphosugar isomerase protein